MMFTFYSYLSLNVSSLLIQFDIKEFEVRTNILIFVKFLVPTFLQCCGSGSDIFPFDIVRKKRVMFNQSYQFLYKNFLDTILQC
jgi:hypothetical protein